MEVLGQSGPAVLTDKTNLFLDIQVFIHRLDALDFGVFLDEVEVLDETQTDGMSHTLHHLTDHRVSHVQPPGKRPQWGIVRVYSNSQSCALLRTK